MSTEQNGVDAEKIAREIVAVLGPRVPSSVTDTGARWEWQHALELAQTLARHLAAPEGDHVFNCRRCPVAVTSRWLEPECPECGDPCELDATAKPAPPAQPAINPDATDSKLRGAQPAAQECRVCGETEPYTGTCGSDDPRALCKQLAAQDGFHPITGRRTEQRPDTSHLFDMPAAQEAGAVDALIRSRLFRMFMQQGFWHARSVDLVWRYNGEDVREEADWLKDVWYWLRGDAHPPTARAAGDAVDALNDLYTAVRAVALSGDYGLDDAAIALLSDALDDAEAVLAARTQGEP